MQVCDPLKDGFVFSQSCKPGLQPALSLGQSRGASAEQVLILNLLQEPGVCTGEAQLLQSSVQVWGCVCQRGSWAALLCAFIYNWQLRTEKVKEKCLQSHHAFVQKKYSWVEREKKEEEEVTKGREGGWLIWIKE